MKTLTTIREGFFSNIGLNDALVNDWMKANASPEGGPKRGNNRYHLQKEGNNIYIIPDSDIYIKGILATGKDPIPSYIVFKPNKNTRFKIDWNNIQSFSFIQGECESIEITSRGPLDISDMNKYISHCSSITFHSSSLKSIKGISDCDNLFIYPNCWYDTPHSCHHDVTNLDGIPANIKRIMISDCKLKDISALKNCKKLSDVNFSNTNIDSIESISSNWMQRVDVSRCKNLKSIKCDIKEVVNFICHRSGVTSLVGGPKKCTYFDCTYCKDLTSLEGLPKDVSIVSATGCAVKFSKEDKYNAQLDAKVSDVPSSIKPVAKGFLSLKDKLKNAF